MVNPRAKNITVIAYMSTRQQMVMRQAKKILRPYALAKDIVGTFGGSAGSGRNLVKCD
jgi:hypothetical protein